MKTTEAQRTKLREMFDRGLRAGLGDEAQTCAEGAACYALYGQISDELRPDDCRAEAPHRAILELNDGPWSSEQARAAGMWGAVVATIGTAGAIDPQRFAARYVELTIRQVLPPVLRAVGLHAEADRCEKEGSAEAAEAAEAAAWAREGEAAAEARKAEEEAAEAAARARQAAAERAAEAAAWARAARKVASASAAWASAEAAKAAAAGEAALILSAQLLVQALAESRVAQ